MRKALNTHNSSAVALFGTVFIGKIVQKRTILTILCPKYNPILTSVQ